MIQATRVGEWLRRRGWRAKEIQGDMPQWQRTEAVAAFKVGTTPLLIATDVAARGLDIPGVECVINYRRGCMAIMQVATRADAAALFTQLPADDRGLRASYWPHGPCRRHGHGPHVLLPTGQVRSMGPR